MKITSAHGTPEQFEAAVRKRIQELNKEDEIITSAAAPDIEIADRDEYITALYHELKAAAPDSISINIEDEDDDSISFVASDGDRVVSFKVPYADMKFDWTHFEDDVDYILTAVNEEFAADGMSDTHNTDAASNILASLQFTDDYEYDTLSAIEDDNITLFNKLKNYPELIKGDEVIIPKGTKLIYDRTDEYYKYYKLPEYGNLRIGILADEYTDFSHHIGTSDETFAKYVDKLNSGVRRFSVKWADVKDFEKYLKDHNISYDTGYGGKASVPFIIKSTVKNESLKASVDNDVTEPRDGIYEYRAASNILASDDNSEINKLNDYIETAFEDIGLPFNKIKHTTDNSFIVEPKENREFTFTDLGEIEEELHRLLSNYDIETSLTDTSNIIITFTLYEEDIEIPRQRGLGYLDKYVEITNEKPSGIPYKIGDIVKGHKILAYLKPKKGYKLKARNNYPLFLTRDTFDNDYVEILIHYNDESEKDFFTNVSFDDFEVIGESLKASDDDDFSDPLEAAQQSFEYGHYAEENDFKSAEDYAQYLEYMDMGPEGFYEEFKDDLDFDDMFVEEYEYDE